MVGSGSRCAQGTLRHVCLLGRCSPGGEIFARGFCIANPDARTGLSLGMPACSFLIDARLLVLCGDLNRRLYELIGRISQESPFATSGGLSEKESPAILERDSPQNRQKCGEIRRPPITRQFEPELLAGQLQVPPSERRSTGKRIGRHRRWTASTGRAPKARHSPAQRSKTS